MKRRLMSSRHLSAELTTSSADSVMSLPILLPLWLLFLCPLCKLILYSLDSAKSPNCIPSWYYVSLQST